MKRVLPWFAIVVVLIGTALVLRSQGRLWLCSCDYLLLWSGDPWSSDNSQHLLDPYSFTHVLHGFVFCGLVALILPRLTEVWQLWVAVSIEAVWEVLENSEFVMREHRAGASIVGRSATGAAEAGTQEPPEVTHAGTSSWASTAN